MNMDSKYITQRTKSIWPTNKHNRPYSPTVLLMNKKTIVKKAAKLHEDYHDLCGTKILRPYVHK